MKRLVLAVLTFTMYAASAFAQPRPTLGALPFTGTPGNEGDTITRLISGQRYLLDTFDVVARNMALSTIFVEREFQLSHLTDPRTMANISEMLDANYILSGNTVRLGGRNLLIASILHAETFRQIAGYYVIYDSIADLIDLAPSIARNLAVAARGQRAVRRVPSLAVIPFSHGPEVNTRYAETLAQILAIEMVNSGRHIVLPRLPIIKAALLEQGFRMRGHTDSAEWAELGRAMNAELVLGGSIIGLGATNMFMSQILNVETGSLVVAENVRYQALVEGIDLMGELAILMTSAPGAQRDMRLSEFRARQGRPIPVPGATLTEQLSWLRANAVSGANYFIELSNDATLAPQSLTLPAGRRNVTVTIRGIGAMRTVKLSSAGSLITVGYGITLVLDNNVVLRGRMDGGFIQTIDHPLVQVDSGGTMVMNAGSQVRSNSNASSTIGGGGIRVNNGGTFVMNGGAIWNIFVREDNDSGSGVHVAGGGTFVMRNGEISRNNDGSGSVHVARGGRFTMYGGSISNNSNSGVHNEGTFTMHAGNISNNTGRNGMDGSRGNDGSWGSRGNRANSPTFGSRDGHSGDAGGNAGAGGLGSTGGTGGVHNIGTFIMHGGVVSENTGGRGGQGGQGGAGGMGEMVEVVAVLLFILAGAEMAV
ncbi:MAG: hypothetical protein FWB78_00355 [Treponema sp.]|nr:hypothetical protein [Treponema sp.]